MTEQGYKKILEWAKRSDSRHNILKYTSKWIPWGIVGVFVFICIFLAVLGDEKLVRFIIVPAIVFILITVIRKAVNAKRPYEVFDIVSLTGKTKSGQSFPSRHTACAVIIAFACFYINNIFGIIMFALAAVVAVTRVICAVHFIKDVLAAALIAAAIGVIGFFII